MTARTIILDNIEPAPLSLRQPVGVPLDLQLTMLGQNGAPIDPTPLYPQLVLSPRTRGNAYGYDMAVSDPANGVASIDLPGNFFNDWNGYRLEVYSRTADGVPTGLLALGEVRLMAGAYISYGPLGPMTVPVVTVQGDKGDPGGPGIQGDPGEPGRRGSQWTTGIGAPSTPPPLDTLAGDMYLDETTGDVWQYNGVDWVRTAP